MLSDSLDQVQRVRCFNRLRKGRNCQGSTSAPRAEPRPIWILSIGQRLAQGRKRSRGRQGRENHSLVLRKSQFLDDTKKWKSFKDLQIIVQFLFLEFVFKKGKCLVFFFS